MTTTATEIQHQPWCNHHLAPPEPAQPGDMGACVWERNLGSNLFVNVDEAENGEPSHVAVWGQGDPMTPEQAREMAAALLQAADIAEASA